MLDRDLRNRFKAILLSVIVLGILALTFVLFRPFLLALLWAAVLATVTYPAYESLTRLLKGRKTVAAIAMTILVLLLIIGPFLALALHLFDDASSLGEDLQPDRIAESLKNLETNETVRRGLAFIERISGQGADLRAWAAGMRKPLMEAAQDFVGFLFSLLVNLALVTFSIFYFYRDGRQAMDFLRDLIPLRDPDRRALLGDLHGAMNAAVRGGLVVAIAQGFLGFIILFILGFERHAFWASVMALASLIPFVGTALVWAPMAILLAVDGEVAKALVLAGYGVLIISMADNLLRPLLVGRHMEAHPLMLFFGILGGISAFGFAGIILGPVVVAFLNASARIFRREVTADSPTAPS